MCLRIICLKLQEKKKIKEKKYKYKSDFIVSLDGVDPRRHSSYLNNFHLKKVAIFRLDF
jgi:hypothetical protein